MQINGRRGRNGKKKFEDKHNDDETGISNETISIVSNNCVSCTQQVQKERSQRSWDKSTEYTGTEDKSNECLRNRCYGRRLRKRISRGVQTEPNKNLSHRINRKIFGLFKFKWCSERKSARGKKVLEQKRSHIANSRIPPQSKSVEVIYNKPRRNRGRNNNFLDKNSDNESITLQGKIGKSTKEKPVQTNGDNYALKKDYKRKYDISLDGKDVEITRTEKSGSVEKRSKLPKKFTESSETDSQVRRANTERNRRARMRSKPDAGMTTVPNERNLLASSDEGSSDVFDERESNKSAMRHQAVTALKRRDDAVDKTARINQPRKIKISKNNRALNNEDKDTRDYTTRKIDEGVISATERPGTEDEKVRLKETKHSSGFKLFSKRRKKPFAPHPRSLDESSHEEVGKRNNYRDPGAREPIDARLDARRKDLADVKKRLDACIADLSDIILNLSKVFQQISDPGGPAGEGRRPENINLSRPDRSRFR